MPASRPRLAAAALAAVVAVVAGCDDARAGDAEVFCADLEANAQAIMNPQLADEADVEAHFAIYRSLAESVPLAIEEEWDVLVRALQSAISVVPSDVESAELARREVYASEESALAVRDWVMANCGLDLGSVGPIGTVAAPPAASTTTVPVTAPG